MLVPDGTLVMVGSGSERCCESHAPLVRSKLRSNIHQDKCQSQASYSSIATAAYSIVYRLFLQENSSGVKVMRKSKSDIVCFITDREVLALYQITVKFWVCFRCDSFVRPSRIRVTRPSPRHFCIEISEKKKHSQSPDWKVTSVRNYLFLLSLFSLLLFIVLYDNHKGVAAFSYKDEH